MQYHLADKNALKHSIPLDKITVAHVAQETAKDGSVSVPQIPKKRWIERPDIIDEDWRHVAAVRKTLQPQQLTNGP